MTHKALIRRLQISCLGLDPIDPLRLLVDDVIEALAQLEQDDGMCTACENNLCTAKQGCVALDNPPQRTWVGLTNEDMVDCLGESCWDDVVRKAEAKLKQLNT